MKYIVKIKAMSNDTHQLMHHFKLDRFKKDLVI